MVTEQIEAGAKLVNDFNQRIPLKAAFWLKDGDEREWYLYLASDRIDDTNFDVAYGHVIQVLGPGPHPWLDPFQVKVRGTSNRMVRDVQEIQQKYPAKTVRRLRNFMLGGVYAEEVLIYPMPVLAAG